MVGKISQRARGYIRKKATENMEATCRIERVLSPTLDETTLHAQAGARTTIYEGPCRIWEVVGGGVFQVAEEEYALSNTNLSIPWDANPVPRRDDEGRIINHTSDSSMIGKRFQITDTAKAGDLRPSRRFQIRLIQENESWSR